MRRALKVAKIANPYKWLAGKVRQVIGKPNARELTAAFDKVMEAFKYFVDLIKRWGTDAMGSRAGQLLSSVQRIRQMLNGKLDELLGPVTEWLNRLARRLEIEGDVAYRASVDTINPHRYQWIQPADEARLLDGHTVKWVDKRTVLPHRPLREFQPVKGWPNLDPADKSPLNNAYATFHNAKARTIPPGETLYRVVDPQSNDNSIYWMRKEEFSSLRIGPIGGGASLFGATGIEMENTLHIRSHPDPG